VPGERGVSKRLMVFSRQAHVMSIRKRRDLRRDVTECRLREDLIGDFPKIA
jgi:hypothetical protein